MTKQQIAREILKLSITGLTSPLPVSKIVLLMQSWFKRLPDKPIIPVPDILAALNALVKVKILTEHKGLIGPTNIQVAMIDMWQKIDQALSEKEMNNAQRD